MGSGVGSGTGGDAVEAFIRDLGAISGGVATLAATDSRRGREDAAVVVAVAVGGGAMADARGGDGTGVVEERLDAAGDSARGVGCLLGCLVAGLLTFGVLGPAGASGICTLTVAGRVLAGCGDASAISGIGLAAAGVVATGFGSRRGVLIAGDGASDAWLCLGVEGEETLVSFGVAASRQGLGTLTWSLIRLGSGGCAVLSREARDASLTGRASASSSASASASACS